MLRFIFAPDSFKGSLSATEVCALLSQAATTHFPQAQLQSIPIADGGEGTVDALVLATRGHTRQVSVTGPAGQPVLATYGILGDTATPTAIVEMAQASGLSLVPPNPLDPLTATSLGTGELLQHLLDEGFAHILIGIGGSATNDGGMGMLTALGARFTDANGNRLHGSGAELSRIAHADLSHLHPALATTALSVICDVTNPLLGPTGATCIYGPQKGATSETMPILEQGMAHYAAVLSAQTGRTIDTIPGAGAAGGMGAALAGVLDAKLMRGIDAVLDIVLFDTYLEETSLVITGEGRIDAQSIQYGKVPAGIAARCARYNVPVIAITGGMGEGAQALYDIADASIITTINAAMPIRTALENARTLLADAADRLFRMLKIGMRLSTR